MSDRSSTLMESVFLDSAFHDGFVQRTRSASGLWYDSYGLWR